VTIEQQNAKKQDERGKIQALNGVGVFGVENRLLILSAKIGYFRVKNTGRKPKRAAG
jgi:hypothetical protein